MVKKNGSFVQGSTSFTKSKAPSSRQTSSFLLCMALVHQGEDARQRPLLDFKWS